VTREETLLQYALIRETIMTFLSEMPPEITIREALSMVVNAGPVNANDLSDMLLPGTRTMQ
jgi:hypothetical protein